MESGIEGDPKVKDSMVKNSLVGLKKMSREERIKLAYRTLVVF